MELSQFLKLLRKYWIGVLSCTLLGLLAAGGLTLRMTPGYTSTTQLFAAAKSSGSIDDLQQGNSFTQARIRSYVMTVTTPLVLQPVIDRLQLDTVPAELAERVTAQASEDTVIITISAMADSPSAARELAAGIANSVVSAVEALESPSGDSSATVNLSVITPATAPSQQTTPNVPLNLVLGLLGGLAVGVLLTVVRSVMDTRIRGEADTKAVTDLPVLGRLAFDKDLTRGARLTRDVGLAHPEEGYRHIRTNLQFARVGKASKTILVTSSLPGEGKTSVASKLAIVMAQSGQRVLLVDADLRRPMVSRYLGVEGRAGLTTLLVGEAQPDDVLQPWGVDGLHVLAAGQIPPNPSELLSSGAMKQLIMRLDDRFDAVIFDAPPLLPVTDAAVLAQHVAGVIVVAGSGMVRTTDLANSLQSLELVGADVLGIVLNKLPAKGPEAKRHGYSYDYEPLGAPAPQFSGAVDVPVPSAGPRRDRQSAARPRHEASVSTPGAPG
jgi:capsular exopolysaccharide synthesis family protein